MRKEFQKLKVLITIKTYPIPSAKYDELVCTAGVNEEGDFVRLYPINFRELPFEQQYKKYQWVELEAEKHSGRDTRKESYRPNCDTIVTCGAPIDSSNNWAERIKYVLKNKALSLEELIKQQEKDNISLGIFKPKNVDDLIIMPDDPDWSPKFLEALKQQRLFEYREKTLEPVRKVPFKFKYKFQCDDKHCKGHQMMIEDWEVGALYWRLIDQGYSKQEASQKVKEKFLNELCSTNKETYFFVGTVLSHPKSWIILGVFYPKKKRQDQQSLFDKIQ